jgi:hypothetical protein
MRSIQVSETLTPGVKKRATSAIPILTSRFSEFMEPSVTSHLAKGSASTRLEVVILRALKVIIKGTEGFRGSG